MSLRVTVLGVAGLVDMQISCFVALEPCLFNSVGSAPIGNLDTQEAKKWLRH